MKLIKRKPEICKIDLKKDLVDFPGSDTDLKHYINVRINAEMAWRFHSNIETLLLHSVGTVTQYVPTMAQQ